MRRMGIRVVAPYESGKVETMHFTLGDFDIQAFDVPHNGCWNNGFYIKTPLPYSQRIIYATDFEYIPYNFRKQEIDCFLIECNYQKKYVDMDAPNYVHKVKGHCELDTCKGIVEANKSDALQNVILCHLSRDNSDAKECVAEVKKIAPLANVDYAAAGKEWILRNGKECPF